MIEYKDIDYEELDKKFKQDKKINVCLDKFRAWLTLELIKIIAVARNPDRSMGRIKYSLMCFFGVLLMIPAFIFGNKIFSLILLFYNYFPEVVKKSLENSLVEISFMKRTN